MSDEVIRGTAFDGQVRAFFIDAKETVQEAVRCHSLSPVAAAALGRSLAAGAMMGAMMKSPEDRLTLQLLGDGPLGSVTVTADALGHVKGFVSNTQVNLPLSPAGKLDVGGAVGAGILRVMRDLGLKEPYVGTTELVSGEVAEDLAYYFASSEQTPSVVALGVLVAPGGAIACAGGFILQLLPFAKDAVIDALEDRTRTLPPVTALLSEGLSARRLAARVLEGFDFEETEAMPVSFACDCSRERVSGSLLAIPRGELLSMILAGEETEVTCQFCGKAYHFTPEELKGMAIADTERKRSEGSKENTES